MKRSDLEILLREGIIRELHYYDEAPSTNDLAKERARLFSVSESAVMDEECYELFIADTQTAGRGRMGRIWKSPVSKNISMSLLSRTALPGESIPGVTLLAALAVTDAVTELLLSEGRSDIAEGIKIKWPNDVVISGRKLSGILTELVFPYIICGIGINVNTPSFPEELSDKATSLLLETGAEKNRAELINDITRRLISYVNQYEQEQDLCFILEKYNKLLVSMDKEVILSGYPDTYIAKGINKTGALLVQDSSGDVISVSSGEVSVRGLYGYT